MYSWAIYYIFSRLWLYVSHLTGSGYVSMAAAPAPLPVLAQKLHPRKDCRALQQGEQKKNICHMSSVVLLTFSLDQSPCTDGMVLQSSPSALWCMKTCSDLAHLQLIWLSWPLVQWGEQTVDWQLSGTEHRALWFFSRRFLQQVWRILVLCTWGVWRGTEVKTHYVRYNIQLCLQDYVVKSVLKVLPTCVESLCSND